MPQCAVGGWATSCPLCALCLAALWECPFSWEGPHAWCQHLAPAQPMSPDCNRLLIGPWSGIQEPMIGPCGHAGLISPHPSSPHVLSLLPHCARLLLTSQLCSYGSLCQENTLPPSSTIWQTPTHTSKLILALTCLLYPRLHLGVVRGLAEGCTIPAATFTRTRAPQGQNLRLVCLCLPTALRGRSRWDHGSTCTELAGPQGP